MFSFLAQTRTVYLYKFVVVRCIPGSALPGCVDDVLSVESDVGSLTVVVSEVVVCWRAVYKRPNIY